MLSRTVPRNWLIVSICAVVTASNSRFFVCRFLLILHRSPGIFQTPTISVPKLQLWRRSNYPLFCTFRRPATMFLYFPVSVPFVRQFFNFRSLHPYCCNGGNYHRNCRPNQILFHTIFFIASKCTFAILSFPSSLIIKRQSFSLSKRNFQIIPPGKQYVSEYKIGFLCPVAVGMVKAHFPTIRGKLLFRLITKYGCDCIRFRLSYACITFPPGAASGVPVNAKQNGVVAAICMDNVCTSATFR